MSRGFENYFSTSWQAKYHLIRAAFGKSSDLTVSGIGPSVIRGLVTNRLMVRREPCYLKAWIMIAHANIDMSQLAQTF